MIYQNQGGCGFRAGHPPLAAGDDNGSNQLVLVHTLRADGHDASEDGSGQGTPLVTSGVGLVRKLTPTECCRLQGFPDDWFGGLRLSNAAKYRGLGNAVAVPCVGWIAGRLLAMWRKEGV